MANLPPSNLKVRYTSLQPCVCIYTTKLERQAAIWALSGSAITFSIGRYAIRWTTRKRFYADDLAHLVALVTYVGFAAVEHHAIAGSYEVIAVSEGARPQPANFPELLTTYRKEETAVSILAYTSYWAVKVGFLLFYRLIFGVSEHFMKAWWIVLVATTVLYWVPIAGVLTACGATKNIDNNVACESELSYQRSVLIYSCAATIFTDVLIMALPLVMIARIQTRLSQKLGLAVVFSVAIVAVVLDILRTVKTLKGGAFSYSILYSVIESAFTVIVSCLPAYRVMLGLKGRTSGETHVELGSRRKRHGGQVSLSGIPSQATLDSQKRLHSASRESERTQQTHRGLYEVYDNESVSQVYGI